MSHDRRDATKFVSLTGEDCCTASTSTSSCDTTITLTDAPCSSAKFVNIPACEPATQECKPSVHVNYTPPQDTTCTPTGSEIIGFLCTLLTTLNSSTDSEIATLCDPSTGSPVIVRYKFSFVNGTQTTIPEDAWNVDGTVYTGDVTELVSCAGGTSSSAVLAEYFICDNGTQKIVQLCGTNCNSLTVSYLLLDRTVSTEPADWELVTLGACAGSGMEVTQGTTPWVVEGGVTVGNFPADQLIHGPVTVASLPLPAGAATSANQVTELASLASIDTKTLAAGQATMAASSPVVIASNQTAIPVTGSLTPSGTQDTNLTEVNGQPVDVGTGASGVGTQRVAVASDSSISVSNFPATQPVSGTVTATQGTTPWVISGTLTPVSIANFPADPSTGAKQTTGNDSLASIDTKASYLTLIYDILLSGVNNLLNAVNYPSYVDRSLQRAKVTAVVESGTVTTVSTVTAVTTVATVTNVAQLATYQAQLPVLDLQRTSWAVNVRSRFT